MAEEVKSVEVVRLISSDGHVFIVEKEAAIISATIKSMLGDGNRQGR